MNDKNFLLALKCVPIDVRRRLSNFLFALVPILGKFDPLFILPNLR